MEIVLLFWDWKVYKEEWQNDKKVEDYNIEERLQN